MFQTSTKKDIRKAYEEALELKSPCLSCRDGHDYCLFCKDIEDWMNSKICIEILTDFTWGWHKDYKKRVEQYFLSGEGEISPKGIIQ